MRPILGQSSPNAGLPDHALAYLLTFSTYGSFLHGDPRGAVDTRKNTVGTPRLPEMRALAAWERRRLLGEPILALTRMQRAICTEAMQEVCEHRSWVLWALNVRSNHVHAVITAPAKPVKVASDLKAYATRALRLCGELQPTQPLWTRRGSHRRLYGLRALENACRYVIDGQGPGRGVGQAALWEPAPAA